MGSPGWRQGKAQRGGVQTLPRDPAGWVQPPRGSWNLVWNGQPGTWRLHWAWWVATPSSSCRGRKTCHHQGLPPAGRGASRQPDSPPLSSSTHEPSTPECENRILLGLDAGAPSRSVGRGADVRSPGTCPGASPHRRAETQPQVSGPPGSASPPPPRPLPAGIYGAGPGASQSPPQSPQDRRIGHSLCRVQDATRITSPSARRAALALHPTAPGGLGQTPLSCQYGRKHALWCNPHLVWALTGQAFGQGRHVSHLNRLNSYQGCSDFSVTVSGTCLVQRMSRFSGRPEPPRRWASSACGRTPRRREPRPPTSNPGPCSQNSIFKLITCLFLSEKLHLECFH